MKQFIKEWGIVFIVAMLVGVFVLPAMAADRQGRCRAANKDDCRVLTFDTLSAVTNSGVLEKTNGITTEFAIAFTNSAEDVVSIWIQHAQAQEADGGVFSNAVSTAIVFDPADPTDYVFVGKLTLLPFVRVHTEDSDITSNNLDIIIWVW